MKVLSGPHAPLAPTAPAATPSSHKLALVGGALGLFALGALATALVMKSPAEAPTAAVSETPTALVAPAATQQRKPVAPTAKSAPAERSASRSTPLDTTPAVAAAPECTSCGVVEASTAIQRQGEATGIGAVAGGVIGGVLGNQVGGGNGRKAMTVIGAVGGGLAGNQIEKRQRATTVYQVKIRMADGSHRTVTRDTPIAVGQRVYVDGQEVTPMAANRPAPAARVVETSARS